MHNLIAIIADLAWPSSYLKATLCNLVKFLFLECRWQQPPDSDNRIDFFLEQYCILSRESHGQPWCHSAHTCHQQCRKSRSSNISIDAACLCQFSFSKALEHHIISWDYRTYTLMVCVKLVYFMLGIKRFT